MKKYLLTFLQLGVVTFVLALISPARAATDVFFTETFDIAASLAGKWTGTTIVTETHGSGLALKIDNGSVVKNTTMQASLTAADVAGRRVVVRGQVKAANVSARPLSYNGVKVMLVYTLSDGSTAYSDQATVSDGTFDWLTFCFPLTVPKNVTAVKITVGLEQVSGTAWFDELRVEADPTIFRETFDDTATISSRWGGAAFTTVTHDSGSALQLTSTNGAGSTVVGTTLPAAVYNGRRVLLTGQVKATNVSTKPNSWNGIKMMITYTTADGQTIYPQADIGVGTFDWTNVYAVVVLPSNVTSITLTLGLEKVTGTVAFDNVKIETAPVLASEYFDDGNVASRWSGGTYSLVAHGATQAMEVTNATAGTSNRLVMTLPYAALRGRQVTLQGLIKATNVSTPPNSWNGVKLMLTYRTPDGVYYYPAVPVGTGTYDWTRFKQLITIPDNITSLTLTIGLEVSTGTVDFDDIVIKADSFSPYWVNPTPNYKGHTVARLRGAMVSPAMTATDLGVLASWNANVVRWQLGATTFTNGLSTATFSTALANELAKLDALLPNFYTRGMAVTLDLHSLSTHQFDNATNQKKLIDTWRSLAARYKNGGTNSYSAAIWGYDINNEPHDDAWTESLLTLNELSEQVALAIREIDPTKAIIIEPYNAEPGRMADLRPVRTTNVVYSIHYYNPWSYVAQGVDVSQPYTPITYPGTIDGTTWNSTKMRANVQATVDFQTKYQASIYVGEFSVLRWAPGGATFLSDCVNLWESLGWDWTYHAFREWQGWSLEIDATTPRTSSTPAASPTDRQQIITNAFSNNVLPAP